MASIDFEDYEPNITPACEPIVADCPHFHVEKKHLAGPTPATEPGDFAIITCLTGGVECEGVTMNPGSFLLVPACIQGALLNPSAPGTSILSTRLPSSE